MVSNFLMFFVYLLIALLIGIIINNIFVKIYKEWIKNDNEEINHDIIKYLTILIIELFFIALVLTIVITLLKKGESYIFSN